VWVLTTGREFVRKEARVFGAGVRPLRIEEALFEAMLDGWRAQQTARYL
jgi:hypothetical protein